jgi:Mannitol-1-phosphate/altronate dehydrogenases
MKNITEVTSTVKRPIKVVQFGEGNFLRAFVDWQIDILNEKGGFNGNVAIVQPLERGMADMINSQKGLYTTVLRGIENGKPVCDFRKITSVDTCINPYSEYEKYMALSTLDTLRFVISNTTEAGIAYNPADKLEDKPQASFPGKVTAFLYNRYKHFNGDMGKGIIFIPCELIEKNGDNLKKYVFQYANEWKLEEGFIAWLDKACDFCNSLVDRIVPGYPRAEAKDLEEQIGYTDNLLDAAEIFHLWVIECKGKTHEDELPTDKAGLNVVWTDDMSFYRTRKVRILNGAHTMTVLAAHAYGLDTVEECTKDPVVSRFMHQGIFGEIIPSMDGDKAQLEYYANAVLERFQNPYIRHLLMSISLNSTSKFKTRDLPSLLGYYEKTGKLPSHLVFSLASLINFYKGTEIQEGALIGHRGEEEYRIQDSEDVLELFAKINREKMDAASTVLGMEAWWGRDLNKVPGLTKMVADDLALIEKKGMKAALNEVVNE